MTEATYRTDNMSSARRAGLIWAAAGTVLGWLLFALIVGLIIGPRAAQTADRLAYAAAWLWPIAVLIFAMSIVAALARGSSPAMDPTAHATESRFLDLSRRILTNTVEQSLIFVLGAFAMAAVTPAGQLGLLGALAILFVVARVAFWIGYLVNPVYRYAGFVLTAEINLVILVWTLVHFV
jgi:hypothetical protein